MTHERTRKNPGWPALREVIRQRAEELGVNDDSFISSMAEAIDVEVRTIRAYIYGDRKPDAERLVRMCNWLKVDESRLRENGPLPPVFFVR